MKQPLSEIFSDVFDQDREPTTYGDVVDEIGKHGIAVILILFALPSALPIPAAGYSTMLSIPLFMIGYRLLAGYDTIWLPAKMRERTFDPKSFSRKLVGAMHRMISFFETFTKPRMSRLIGTTITRIAIGILIIALAASMALPIYGTNTAPAFGIFLIGFALLEEDGLMLILGVLASLVALVISLTIIFFGYQSYLNLKYLIISLF